MGLSGRVAVVTGASAGIGAALARALANQGARVMLGARRRDRLQDLCDEINAAGGTAAFEVTDLADEAQATALVDSAQARFGAVDILINNAAIGTVRTIAEGVSAEWRAIFDTNVIAVLTTCRAALRHMLPVGRGDIVNVTSASAYEAWPYLSVYGASKAAVHNLSAGLRAEVSARGIRVMTVDVHNVGGTDFASNFDRQILPEAIQSWEKLGLLRRDSAMIHPEDVARAVVQQLSHDDPVSIHHLSIRTRAN